MRLQVGSLKHLLTTELDAEAQRFLLQMYRWMFPTNVTMSLLAGSSLVVLLWGAIPAWILVGWLSLHLIQLTVSLTRMSLNKKRPKKDRASVSPRQRIEYARIQVMINASIWGLATSWFWFLNFEHRLILLMVLSAMIAGASTTLAAIPSAVNTFILFIVAPTAIYHLVQFELVPLSIAVLSICMGIAMQKTGKIIYGSFIHSIHAHLETRAMLDRIESERREWFEISDSAEGFALFDAEDKLLLWNPNFAKLLSIDSEALQRGKPRKEILELQALPEYLKSDHKKELWIEREMIAESEPCVIKLTNGHTIQRTFKRTPREHLAIILADVTDLVTTQAMLRQRENALQESTRMGSVGAMVDGISRDINNVLATVTGNIQLLKNQQLESAQVKKINRIEDAAAQGAELMRRLHAFTHPLSAEIQTLDAKEAFEHVQPIIERWLPRRIPIHIVEPKTKRFFKMSSSRFEQIFVQIAIHANQTVPDRIPLGLELTDEFIEAEYASQLGLSPGQYIRFSITGGAPLENPADRHEDLRSTPELDSALALAQDSGGTIYTEPRSGAGIEIRLFLPMLIGVDSKSGKNDQVLQQKAAG